MKLILIRHSKTKVEPTISSLLWKLSEEGVELAKKLSTNELIKNTKVIYTSYQTKAVETALLLAKDNYIPVRFDNNLTELTSITNGFIQDYEKSIKDLYEDVIKNINKGETIHEGLNRFNKSIEQIVAIEKDKDTIAIVSHCNILAIFSSQFSDKSAHDIHKNMSMPDVAILDWDKKEFIKFYGDTI